MTKREKIEFTESMLEKMKETVDQALISFGKIETLKRMNVEDFEFLKNLSESFDMFSDWIHGVSFEMCEQTELLERNNELLEEIKDMLVTGTSAV